MRHYKRILAAIGSAALLISSLGAVPQTVFAEEQLPVETVLDDSGGGSRDDPEVTVTETSDLSLQTTNEIDNTPVAESEPEEADPPSDVEPTSSEDSTPPADTDNNQPGQNSSASTSDTDTKADPPAGTDDGTDDQPGEDTPSDNTADPTTPDTPPADSDTSTDPDNPSADTTDTDKADTAADPANAGTDTTPQPTDGAAAEDETDPEEDESQPTIEYENTDVDGLKVTARAQEGAFPEDYDLHVKQIKDSDQLTEIEETLRENDSDRADRGFVAYDVYFANDDDDEAEPEYGSVQITFELDELPEEVGPKDLEIQHIDESGDEVKVVTVADMTDGAIALEQSDDDTPPAVTAQFDLDSLSILVLSGDDGISMADISGSTTVQAGSYITLYCDNWRNCASGSWSSSDTSIATVSGYRSSATVTGIKRGTVTISHQHWVNRQWSTETIEVTVTGYEERAQVYAQATPSSDASSNNSTEWTPLIGEAVICVDDAVWDRSGKNTTGTSSGESATAFMVSWPDGSTGGTWNLTNDYDYNDNDYFDKLWGYIETAYESALADKLGLQGTLDPDEVKSIVLTPYKVSQNNGTSPDKHVDCTISVTVEKQYTVQFNVKEVGETDYHTVHADRGAYTMTLKNYVGEADPVAEYIYEYTDADGNTEQYRIGDTRVDPDTGTTYRLTGWYTENDQGAARSDDIATFENGYYKPKTVTYIDEQKNTVTQLPELRDYVLNLYAEWEIVTGSLQVTKNVISDLGQVDPDRKYDITIHLNGVSNKTYGGYYFDANGNCTVSLANGESVQIDGIDSGTTYTVTEAATSSTGYKVSYTHTYYDEDNNIIENHPAQTIPADGKADVKVNNTQNIVRTGVDTDDTTLAAMLTLITMMSMGTVAYTMARRHYMR